jgi:hypothetical protein
VRGLVVGIEPGGVAVDLDDVIAESPAGALMAGLLAFAFLIRKEK